MPIRPKGPWLRKGRGYFCWLNGRQINLYTKNRDIAWEAFYRIMGEAGKPVPAAERSPISVLEIIERFCDWAEKHRKPETSAHYDQFCKGFMKDCPSLKNAPARDLRPFHVQGWIDQRDGWSTTTQNRAAASVKRAYSWAVEQGLIDADPIRPLRKAKSRRRLRILSGDEWAALLSACPNGAVRDFLTMQRLTGARPQELRAAEIRHFDRRGKCLRFPAIESKGGIARVVMLTSEAMSIVERSIGRRTEGAVLLNTLGDPWTRVGLRMALRRLAADSGIAFDAYTGRHSYATDALIRGVDSVTVGVLMGHVDPSMVARIYSHLDQKPSYLSEAAEKAVRVRTDGKRKAAPKARKKPPAKSSAKKPRKATKR